ncbi:MAG: ribosome silencing factor [Parachlamydiaceae bacterium]|nr:ribosome silencing factor [Parachlamydiaceae bacterium]
MSSNNGASKLLDVIAQAIFDKKGVNILALDVSGISTMTDYFVIAEGNVDRHLSAICTSIVDAMKQRGEIPLHVEGLRDSDWVIIDFGFIVVHLFTPDMREKYAIEQLWKEGKLVDVNIIINNEGNKNAYYI